MALDTVCNAASIGPRMVEKVITDYLKEEHPIIVMTRKANQGDAMRVVGSCVNVLNKVSFPGAIMADVDDKRFTPKPLLMDLTVAELDGCHGLLGGIDIMIQAGIHPNLTTGKCVKVWEHGGKMREGDIKMVKRTGDHLPMIRIDHWKDAIKAINVVNTHGYKMKMPSNIVPFFKNLKKLKAVVPVEDDTDHINIPYDQWGEMWDIDGVKMGTPKSAAYMSYTADPNSYLPTPSVATGIDERKT